MQSIPKDLAAIARSNPGLVRELHKLPEIKTFQTPSVSLALRNMRLIYEMAPDAMDNIFGQINPIGLPAVRDYSTLLQALFWLIQDENVDSAGALLGINIEKTIDAQGRFMLRQIHGQTASPFFSQHPLSEPELDKIVKKILDAAWKRETRLIPASMIHEIIHRICTNAEKEEYALLIRRHSDLQLQGYIMDDFLTKKDIFDSRDWEIIKTAIHHSRWKEFFTVADRLNTPRIVSYYINTYFNFRKTPAHGVYLTFYKGLAQCTDAAYFAQYMLKRAGYKTFMRSVKWDKDPWDGLHTGAGIILDDGSYQLAANYNGINSVSGGPYRNVAALDEKLSCGNKLIDSQWGAYYPPRYY